MQRLIVAIILNIFVLSSFAFATCEYGDNTITCNINTYTLNGSAILTEAGDGSSQLSSWSLKGMTASNTDNGILYWSLTNSGTTRTVKLFNSSSMADPADLVASGSVVGNGTLTFTSSVGISGQVVVTYTTDDNESANKITIDTSTLVSLLYTPMGTYDDRVPFFRVNPNVPKNATITSATLSLLALATASSSSNVTFSRTPGDNCSDFASVDPYLAGIDSTTSNGTIGTFTIGQVTESSDFSSIITDWIGEASYSYGDYFCLRVDRNGSTTLKTSASVYSADYEGGDTGAQISSPVISGVESGNSSNGMLFWTITGASTHTLSLYSDLAHSQLVASGSWTGSSSTPITLTEENSSGITGTVTVIYTGEDTDAGNYLVDSGGISAPTITIDFTGGDPWLDVYMADPHVRSSQYLYVQLWNTEATQKLKVYLDGTLAYSKTSDLAGQTVPGEEVVLVDYTGLTNGEHTLRIVVTDASDNEYATSEWTRTWTTTHDGSGYVHLDKDNNVVVNGSKYFILADYMQAPSTWLNYPNTGDKRIDWFNTQNLMGTSGYSSSVIYTPSHPQQFLNDCVNTAKTGSTETYMALVPASGGDGWGGFSAFHPRYSAVDFTIAETFEGSGSVIGTCGSSYCWTFSSNTDPDYSTSPIAGTQSLLLDGVTEIADVTATLDISKDITTDSQTPVPGGLGEVKMKWRIKDITSGGLHESEIFRILNRNSDVFAYVTWNADGTLSAHFGTEVATTTNSCPTNTVCYVWLDYESERQAYGDTEGRLIVYVSTSSTKPAGSTAAILSGGYVDGVLYSTGSGSSYCNSTGSVEDCSVHYLQWVAQENSKIVVDEIADDMYDIKEYVEAIRDSSTYPALLAYDFDDEPDMGGMNEYNPNYGLWKDFIRLHDTSHLVTTSFYGDNYHPLTYTTSSYERGLHNLYMTSDQYWGYKRLPADLFIYDYYTVHYSESVGYPYYVGMAASVDYVINNQYNLIPVGLVLEPNDLTDKMCLSTSQQLYFQFTCDSVNDGSSYEAMESHLPIASMTGGTFKSSRKRVAVSKIVGGLTRYYRAIQDHWSTTDNAPGTTSGVDYWEEISNPGTGNFDSWKPMIEHVAVERPRFVKVASKGCAELLDVRIIATDIRFDDYFPKPHPDYNNHIVINKKSQSWEAEEGDSLTEYSDSLCSTSPTGVTSSVYSASNTKVPNMTTSSKYKPNSNTGRIYWSPAPSNEMLSNLAFITIVHGAKALAYFPYHITYYNMLKDGLKDIKDRMNGTGGYSTDVPLKEILFGSISNAVSYQPEMKASWATATMAGNGRVDYTAREYGGKTYIIATRVYKHSGDQVTSDTATFTISGLDSGTSIAVLGESRTLTSGAGAFSDSFAVNDYHIYELGGSSNSTKGACGVSLKNAIIQ